ncbi:MAG: HEAT repeat domain-containing protein, partial [Bryobacteraceae bacterium]
KERAKAVRETAKEGPGAIDKLKPLLADADNNVRVEVAKAIAEIGGRNSIDALVQATKDNDASVQAYATDGLVNFYLPGYLQTSTVQRLSSIIKSKFVEKDEQIIPVYVLVPDEVIAALGRLARGGASMESRAGAARAVGILRGKAAIPDLLEALRAKDDTVIYESLMALQKMRDPDIAPKITFLLRDPNEKIQVAALETVGLLMSKEANPELQKAYDRARNTKIRRAALSALAMVPLPENRGYFEKATHDKDDGIRAAAFEGYARLKDPADLATIQTSFDAERKAPPRLAQAFALVSLGNTEISQFSPAQYLIDTLNSKQRHQIAEAYLTELARVPVMRAAVNDAALHGTRDEKIGISHILAVSGDQTSIAPLDTLTKDPDPEVAQESLRALRSLKTRLE